MKKALGIVVLLRCLLSPATAISNNSPSLFNLGAVINTTADEFSPSLTADGRELYYNTKKQGDRYMDIYRSRLTDGNFSAPEKVTEICSPYNDEAPFIAPDGSYILFASDRDGSTEMAKDEQGIIRVSFDLYIAYRQGNGFTRPQRLTGKVNSPHHEKAPYLHQDGYLYFTRYPFGDISRSQILRAKRLADGSFAEPELLPAEINSGYQEVSLTGAPGGFYFSSKRPGSHGWDIYYISHTQATVENPETWGRAIRLPEPINSEQNETFLHYHQEGGYFYFSSNRDGGYGRFDIYGARETKPEKEIYFTIRDRKSGSPVSAIVNFTARKDTERTELSKPSDTNGLLSLKIHPAIEALEIKIDHNNYLPVYRELRPDQLKDGDKIIIEMDIIETNASFTVHAIHFDYNSAKLRPESLPYLDALATYLQRNLTIHLRIIGHTDLTGPEEFNLKLSRARAEAVRDYLISRGISSSRLQSEGAGKSHPLSTQKTPEADALNRRTEFKIISK